DYIAEETAAALSRHQPVSEAECTSCHNPHQAMLNTLLLATSPDLCMGCHTALKEKMATEKVHAPAGRDCQRCHQPHSAKAPRLLSMQMQELCAECHEPGGDSFQKSHIGIEAAAMNCVQCHDPHSSKDQMFFRPVMHAPFVARSCDPCHITEDK
ncbi:MAG: cytochrome c3 family protein, partial [Desulfurivibrionaceae bacterium]|nr:cytochrome c3 family protein [Desulfurivibrionaceae bacterium]